MRGRRTRNTRPSNEHMLALLRHVPNKKYLKVYSYFNSARDGGNVNARKTAFCPGCPQYKIKDKSAFICHLTAKTSEQHRQMLHKAQRLLNRQRPGVFLDINFQEYPLRAATQLSGSHQEGTDQQGAQVNDVPKSCITPTIDPCCICLQNITLFGMLENCPHCFCASCLLEWLKKSATKNCPLCRAESTRSIVWPCKIDNKDEKMRIFKFQQECVEFFNLKNGSNSQSVRNEFQPANGIDVNIQAALVQQRWEDPLFALPINIMVDDIDMHDARIAHAIMRDPYFS